MMNVDPMGFWDRESDDLFYALDDQYVLQRESGVTDGGFALYRAGGDHPIATGIVSFRLAERLVRED